ncbi:unnamed protein product [Ectocarpus sp. CCAP 1310/34]|nr:unnamed protein product [Ectocarpus sp. CCAP 1310/34]
MKAAKLSLDAPLTGNAAVRAEPGIRSLRSGRDARTLTWQYRMWKGFKIDEGDALDTDGPKGSWRRHVAFTEREEQNIRNVTKDKEGIEVYRMLKKRIGFKEYLHGPVDTGTKLKVEFRTGDIDIRERRRRYGKADDEDANFKCDCGSECEDRVHVVAECRLYKKQGEGLGLPIRQLVFDPLESSDPRVSRALAKRRQGDLGPESTTSHCCTSSADFEFSGVNTLALWTYEKMCLCVEAMPSVSAAFDEFSRKALCQESIFFLKDVTK